MIDTPTLDRLLALPPEERLALVEALWNSLADAAQDPGLPEGHAALLDERLDEDDRAPDDGLSWADVRRGIESRGA